MKNNNKHAREILTKQLIKYGGEAFARWLANQNPESKKTAEANDFMMKMFDGEFNLKDEEYLELYLKPMREIIKAINILNETE